MITDLMRENIKNLAPYRCARDEAEGEADVYLDANESWRDFVSFENINRYPDPRCTLLRHALDEVLGLPFKNTVVGNGSDEIIDLLFRIFCEPGKDKVLLLPPTYGAYSVFAAINDVKTISVPLDNAFGLDLENIKKTLKKENPKLTFICSPNNPTGNAYSLSSIEEVIKCNDGITVVDEAYFEFSSEESAVTLLEKYSRLVILRTLSKCWGLAGARLGIGIMCEELQKKMVDVKYPYNVPLSSQMIALKGLKNADEVLLTCKEVIKERERMKKALSLLDGVECVYPSSANFLLCKIDKANEIYSYLQEKKIIVRNRSREYNCESTLRITIGSKSENDKLLRALEEAVWT